MKNAGILGIIVLALVFSLSCGEKQPEKSMKMETVKVQMKSDQAWVRAQPVDVKAVDSNNDGYVYQDPMDWNVISDEEGKCPLCGMKLEKVTVEEAIKNLKDKGYTVKE